MKLQSLIITALALCAFGSSLQGMNQIKTTTKIMLRNETGQDLIIFRIDPSKKNFKLPKPYYTDTPGNMRMKYREPLDTSAKDMPVLPAGETIPLDSQGLMVKIFFRCSTNPKDYYDYHETTYYPNYPNDHEATSLHLSVEKIEELLAQGEKEGKNPIFIFGSKNNPVPLRRRETLKELISTLDFISPTPEAPTAPFPSVDGSSHESKENSARGATKPESATAQSLPSTEPTLGLDNAVHATIENPGGMNAGNTPQG